jgi:nucleoside-diphosphate-sugar epimerase
MAQLVLKSAGRGRIEYVDWPASAASVETGDFVANTARMATCIGWKASLPLTSGIDDVVSRYRMLGPSGI